MGFGFILAGFLLLLNPVVHVIDIIPDFIGFLLIWKGLSKLSYLHSGFSAARELFLRLVFVELAKTGCILFVPGADGSTLILFAFVFGFLELLFFLPAVNHLFDGLYYVGMRYESRTVFAKKGNKKGKTKEIGPSVKRLTIVFYIIRVVATFLPELTELQMYEHKGAVTAMAVDYTRFKPLFHVLTWIVVLTVGICWCVKLRYFGRIRREKDFIARLSEVYDRDISPKTWVFMAKRMKGALAMYILAAVLSLCLEIERINVLPGVLSAAILIVCAVLIGKDVKGAYASVPFSLVRGVLSVINLKAQDTYFIEDKFDEVAIQFVDRAAEQYNRMSILQGIEYGVAAVSFLVLGIMLMKAVKKHLAETGTQNESVQYNKRNRDAETARFVNGKVIANLVLMVLNFTASALYLPMLPSLAPMGILRSVVTVIWVLHSIYMVSHINDAVYTPLAGDSV